MGKDEVQDVARQMDAIYVELPLDKIPWNIEHPPDALVEGVEAAGLQRCEAVDLGCGAGNYAVWLAEKGFRVTGVDVSPKAIDLARARATARGVTCRFVAADVLGDLSELHGAFDFAYDWELLHHIFPEQRRSYVRNVQRLLRPGGRYLSVCFSEQDTDFGGAGKYRKTRIGTTLYFSSEDELRELFEPLFEVHDLRTSQISGKYGPHAVVIAWMARR